MKTIPFAYGSPQVPADGAKLSKTASLILTTVTSDGSAATITYAPSTLGKDTTITQGQSSTALKAGEVVGAMAGAAAGAAVAAILIPKPPPEPIPGEPPTEPDDGDDDEEGCEKRVALRCTEECFKTKFVSKCKLESSTSCSQKACSTVRACNAVPGSSTIVHEPSWHKKVTATRDTVPLPTFVPGLDAGSIQAYLGKEFQRQHSEYPNSESGTEAKCEEDQSKDIVEKKGIENNIKDFCKKNVGYAASPNKALSIPYEQKSNRGQVNLVVAYNGDRGQGAIYTVDEKVCNSAFSKILDCEVGEDYTRGGNYTVDKGVFSVESYIHKGDLKCAPKDQKFGLETNEAAENIRNFCSQHNKKKITNKNELSMRELQKNGAALNTLNVRWTNESPGCGDGGKLFKNGYPINEDACIRFLTRVND